MSKRVFLDPDTGHHVEHNVPGAEPRRPHRAVNDGRNRCVAPAFRGGQPCRGWLLPGSWRHYPGTYWQDTSDRTRW